MSLGTKVLILVAVFFALRIFKLKKQADIAEQKIEHLNREIIFWKEKYTEQLGARDSLAVKFRN